MQQNFRSRVKCEINALSPAQAECDRATRKRGSRSPCEIEELCFRSVAFVTSEESLDNAATSAERGKIGPFFAPGRHPSPQEHLSLKMRG